MEYVVLRDTKSGGGSVYPQMLGGARGLTWCCWCGCISRAANGVWEAQHRLNASRPQKLAHLSIAARARITDVLTVGLDCDTVLQVALRVRHAFLATGHEGARATRGGSAR